MEAQEELDQLRDEYGSPRARGQRTTVRPPRLNLDDLMSAGSADMREQAEATRRLLGPVSNGRFAPGEAAAANGAPVGQIDIGNPICQVISRACVERVMNYFGKEFQRLESERQASLAGSRATRAQCRAAASGDAAQLQQCDWDHYDRVEAIEQDFLDRGFALSRWFFTALSACALIGVGCWFA